MRPGGGSRVGVGGGGDEDDDDDDDDDDDSFDDPGDDAGAMLWDRSIGPKVDRARLLRGVLEGGCPLEDRSGGVGG